MKIKIIDIENELIDEVSSLDELVELIDEYEENGAKEVVVIVR